MFLDILENPTYFSGIPYVRYSLNALREPAKYYLAEFFH